MTNNRVSLNDFTDKLASMAKFKDLYNQHDNKESRKKIMKIIGRVSNGELTERQKQCFYMYYQENMRMVEISNSLGICVSCVSRHIKKAKLRVYKTLSYYSIR